MSNPPKIPQNPHPNARVVLSLHQLYVEIEHEAIYPDQITDMSSRAYDLFVNALRSAKEAGMDIRKTPDYDFDEDEDLD
jgi:hypothetical protein